MKLQTSVNQDRLYGLDVVRATAIILVVLYHWPKTESQQIFRIISHFGYLGVDLFFVLSGYLITGQSLGLISKGKFGLKSFYVRRFMRTLPNYYIILLISAFLEGLNRYDWRYLFFLQNIGGIYSFTHSWSLCVEEHFYLFLPLILIFIARKNWFKYIPTLTIMILASEIIIRWIIWNRHRPDLAYAADVNQGYEIYFKHLFYPTYTRLDGLAIGSFLAYLKHFQKSLWSVLMDKTHYLFAMTFIILLPVFYLIYNKTHFFNSVLGYSAISIGMAFLVVSSLSEKSVLQKVKIPGITFVSILSYSIYLTHGHALDLSYFIGKHFSLSPYGLIQIILQTFLILGIASMLYWGLEKPILKRRDMILKKI
ncbi:MAG: acyltransferase [Bacteriovorax sp.]|nr:acyltransferase [Bacteriovorax sp.]